MSERVYQRESIDAAAPEAGTRQTGGRATGGAATGGKATGGAATGGKATGGTATGGAATGGATDAGSPCKGVYCEDFEAGDLATMPSGWTRIGGSAGDWELIASGSKVLAQDHASSSTFRVAYASSASAWTGPTSVSARVQVTALGSSGTPLAQVCLRFTTSGDFHCLALMPGTGAQLKSKVNGAVADGPIWPETVNLGAWYEVKVGMDANHALSAWLGTKLLGSVTPASFLDSGYVGLATQSAQASFDDVVVSQP